LNNLGMIKSVAGAVLCGVGITYGIAMSAMRGSGAWVVAVVFVVLGFVVAAVPLPKGGSR